MTDRWSDDQLARTIRWVLSLEYAGGTWYLSDYTATADDGNGGTISISDGLFAVSGAEEAIDLWSTDTPRRSCGVEFDLGVDIAALIEQGQDLAGCIAELSQLAEGDAWTDRRPFVRGRLSDPQYGAVGESVKASIEQDVMTSDVQIEPVTFTYREMAEAIEATSTFELVTILGNDTINTQVTAPVIIGTPGASIIPGSKAVAIPEAAGEFWQMPVLNRYIFWVIAGHAVEANYVTLQAEDLSEQLCGVQQVTLANGNVISYVRVQILGGPAPTWYNRSPTMTVKWTHGGGMVEQTVGSLTTAGDFIAWMLTLTPVQVDLGRLATVRGLLAPYKVSTYIDEAVAISDYVRDVIFDVVPVSFVAGPHGIYPYVWRWDATTEDAVAELDTTSQLDVTRESLVTYEGADKIINTITLKHGLSAVDDEFKMVAVGGADDHTLTTYRKFWSDSIISRSVARYGIKPATIETALVHDIDTALRVIAWQGRRKALPSRVVSYSCDQRWGWIEPGDYVTVTDPELAWSKKLCLVQSRAWADDGTVRYSFRVQES